MPSITDLLPVRAVYLHQALIELFVNGLYTALFFAMLYAMVFKRQTHRNSPGLLIALVAMYILSTVHVASRWIQVKLAFIDHAETSITTVAYLIQPPLWLALLAGISLTTTTLISDCVLVWRCWTVWNRNWKIVILPLLTTFVGAGLGFRSLAEQAAYVINPKLDRRAFVDFATPYFTLSLVTTCLATTLIILRIVTMTEPAARKSRGYGRVIEIIVESAVLYSVSLIVFLPFLVAKSFNDGYPEAVVAQMTGIAPTLIAARASFGLARPDAMWQAPMSLDFVRSTRTEHPSTSVALSRVDIDIHAEGMKSPWVG
ncbi:hypothetical protein FB451DRAFT_173748 [Mycena latifolia]|nr:hypothetical protein FB451DRAFT_417592 [Mycena latifolia]KAJ7479136.1 hypothetical protein FB451DRAFT_173748 [Mycena latifolia]